MVPPEGSKTKQGYELQYGVNNVGHFLLTWFLRPVLEATAMASSIENSVRVIWVSSSAADGAAVDLSNMDYKKSEGMWAKYARSKAASVLHAVEFGIRTKGTGVVSLVRHVSDYMIFASTNKNLERL
ncbi:hypothetical protein GQ44DRAFT_723479 [Phaeosphaeriaceae sp. PMI808]|nr:hypothetical protein GQ44DRAFT_723479 [Phaeosphaeriaceae sp. PMI808]